MKEGPGKGHGQTCLTGHVPRPDTEDGGGEGMSTGRPLGGTWISGARASGRHSIFRRV